MLPILIPRPLEIDLGCDLMRAMAFPQQIERSSFTRQRQAFRRVGFNFFEQGRHARGTLAGFPAERKIPALGEPPQLSRS